MREPDNLTPNGPVIASDCPKPLTRWPAFGGPFRHSRLKRFRSVSLTFAALLTNTLFATQYKFDWYAYLDFGSYVDAYPIYDNWGSTSSFVSGYFVIDDQLIDTNPDPTIATYLTSALFYVNGAAGTALGSGNFSATFEGYNQTIFVGSPIAGIALDFYDSPFILSDVSEIFDHQYGNIEATFVSVWGLGIADNGAFISCDGPYASPAVPDSSKITPVIVLIGMLVFWKHRSRNKYLG